MVKKNKGEKKNISAILDKKEDEVLLNKITVAKAVGGIEVKTILEYGVNAYLKTPEYKTKAKLIQV